MKRLRAAIGVAALVLPTAAPAQDCASTKPAAEHITAGSYRMMLNTDPEDIAVGEYFTVNLLLCHESGAPFAGTLRVDADMPAHGHGMNYRPAIVQVAAGRFRAEGLMFHMPGEWRLEVSLDDGEEMHTIEVLATVH